ncbi:MAG: hypothetical protein IKH24_00375 [Bacteroidales bacterium]|nr:hypothetical protein [Bacteroidales bacterium]
MTAGSDWEDVFADDEGDGDEAYFEPLGARFFDFYKVLTPVESIRFHITETLKEAFNQWFKYIHDTYPQMLGEDFKASDFQIAMTISKAVLAHFACTYNVLPKTPVTGPNPASQKTRRRRI